MIQNLEVIGLDQTGVIVLRINYYYLTLGLNVVVDEMKILLDCIITSLKIIL